MRRALEDGRLCRFSRSVLVDAARAVEFWTRAAAGVLTVGSTAVLTGHSALAAYGCGAAATAPIHLLVPYHCKNRGRPGLKLHRGHYEQQDVDRVGGLPTLVMDAALAEVLSRGHRRVALACADDAVRLVPDVERAEFRAWVGARVDTRPDSRGRLQAHTLLRLTTGLSESPAESAMLLSLVDGGLPVPEQQYSVTDLRGREIYRLDFAWPEMQIAVEYDGYEAHEGKASLDAARDADLRQRGWIVVRARAADLADPSRVLAEVETAFRRRGFAA